MLIQCPACKKQTTYDPSNPYRPFCAAKCKDLDFIAWADETFVLSREITEDDLEDMGSQPEDILH